MKKQYFSYPVLLILVISMFGSACKKPSSVKNEDLTTEEILVMPPPTYGQIIQAYELVTKSDSSLIKNEPKLLQAIVKWIKNRPNGELSSVTINKNIATVSNNSIDLAKRMTPAEWKIFIQNVSKTVLSITTARDAELDVVPLYSCDNTKFDDTKLNAVYHAYWSALMAKRSGVLFAREFSTAHESLSPTGAPNTKMDLHNNKTGIELVEKYPTATDEEILELLIHQKFTYILPLDKFPESIEGLIYITDKRTYDGTMSGTLTNPDSGGTWNVTFDFSQCGDVLRGQMIIIRGNENQKRRFTGTVSNSGTILLNVSAPFIFENPNNLPYCSSMVFNLSGNENRITGNWSSSNCQKGGVISISK